MARPSPRAMVRLWAKTDTSVNPATAHRTALVPMMATTPTSRGRTAEATLPKTHTRMTRVRGSAIISERTRSSAMVVSMSLRTAVCPPTLTVRGPWSPP